MLVSNSNWAAETSFSKSLLFLNHHQLSIMLVPLNGSRDSVVSIAPRCGIDVRGSIPDNPRAFLFSKNFLTPALRPTQPPIECVPEIFPDGKMAGAWFWLFSPHMPSQLVEGQFYLLADIRWIPLDNIRSNYFMKYVFGNMLILHLFTYVIFKLSLTYKADTVQNVSWVMDKTVAVDFLSVCGRKF
jgi:hypothetical protein